MSRPNRRERRAAIRQMKKRGSWAWERREPPAEVLREHPWGNRWMGGFVNDTYSVQAFALQCDWGLMLHLVVRRHDGKPPRDWKHLQRIKNELASPEAVAVEVFPRQADVVDQANLAHLWCLPPGAGLPFGLHTELYAGKRVELLDSAGRPVVGREGA